MHWEELVKNMTRPLTLCDLDFTDLRADDDIDDMTPRGLGNSVPPPPPPIGIPPPLIRPEVCGQDNIFSYRSLFKQLLSIFIIAPVIDESELESAIIASSH